MKLNLGIRAFGVVRTTDNKVSKEAGGDLGGRKHKSPLMIYFRGPPTFTEKTEQQKAISLIGQYCAEVMRKAKGYKDRKLAVRECAREFAGMKPSEIIAKLKGGAPTRTKTKRK